MAAEHLARANGIAVAEWAKRGQGYDCAAHTRFVDRLIAAFDRVFFEGTPGLGSDSKRPIFVVGLPRLGTTLTEQVLASHSQVFGAGELRLAHESFTMLDEAKDGGTAAFETLSRLDGGLLQRIAERHLGRLGELGGRQAARGGQDAGQLPLPGPAGGAVPAGEVTTLRAGRPRYVTWTAFHFLCRAQNSPAGS